MLRIAIVGISGTGKTTYARKLSALTGLSLHHMDSLFWRGEWEVVPEKLYISAQSLLIAKSDWIIEGYIDPALSERAHAADLIIDLDFPGWLCAWRVILRWLRHRSSARAELPKEATERLRLRFLWIVLSRAERPAIDAALAMVDPAKIRHVTSLTELNAVTVAITQSLPNVVG